MQKVKYNGFDPKLSEPEVKNNLDPGQATMVVFTDTMYTYRDTQGGVKIDNLFSFLAFVTASN